MEIETNMDETEAKPNQKASSLRWGILRQALLRRPSSQSSVEQSTTAILRISRKNSPGFNLIKYQLIEEDRNSGNARICYTLPVDGSPKLLLAQRINEGADLSDFEISNRYNIDNTGLVYIQRNIEANAGVFGHTKVKSMTLHWDEKVSNISNSFDVIVASDCTFFKDFHNSLASTVKVLLRNDGKSEAIFLGPKRGDSLDKFLEKIEENGMCFSVIEEYDREIWMRHQQLMSGDKSWPSYEKDHCYPLLKNEFLGYGLTQIGRPRVKLLSPPLHCNRKGTLIWKIL
ncbi:calmodulin-lysine N-methyltransferase isoform X4 [Euphorbia lathyris]|uniref:calmodulin-lysine N-methyltransferase isoform X4 n=1 Tax=Euphorbia lathyris TaxID=212925 RepID=UPI003313E352